MQMMIDSGTRCVEFKCSKMPVLMLFKGKLPLFSFKSMRLIVLERDL